MDNPAMDPTKDAEIIALANLLKSNTGESTKPEVLRQVATQVAEQLMKLTAAK